MPTNSRIKDIVKRARGEMNQADFSRLLGKSQGLLSKYERGTINPPAKTIEKCMEILAKRDSDDISSESLAKRVRAELKTPELAFARKTIATILDGIEASRK